MSKSGYLTKNKNKRHYADFINDFKKKHKHDDDRIKDFYYMIHESFYDKAIEKLVEKMIIPSAIYTYDNNCNITRKINAYELGDKVYKHNPEPCTTIMYSCGRKLFLEEQFQLARLGAMRYKNMTERLIKK